MGMPERTEHDHRDTETQRFDVSDAVIGAAIEVHRELGPGLFESVYELALAEELRRRDIQFVRQLEVPLTYKGLSLGQAYRLDLLVEQCLVVEIKAVEQLLPVHTAQVLTYLKLLELRTGLLINFNQAQLKQGIKRVAK